LSAGGLRHDKSYHDALPAAVGNRGDGGLEYL
jgi:hypothetical protein